MNDDRGSLQLDRDYIRENTLEGRQDAAKRKVRVSFIRRREGSSAYLSPSETTSFPVRTDTPWEILERLADLTVINIADLIAGRIPAIRIPGALSVEACAEVIVRLRHIGIGRYEGMSQALGTLWPNRWVARYITGDWDAYFSGGLDAEKRKRQVFAPNGDI